MADPFKKVKEGEDIEFSATAWNAMLDAGQAEARRRHNQGTDVPGPLRSGTLIKVWNQTGLDLGQNCVLALGDPIFTPDQSLDAFLREVLFKGETPGSFDQGKFCVLLEPVLHNRVARAWIDGVVQVKVNMIKASHTCADAASGQVEYLESSEDGTASILWREKAGQTPSTGIQWAIVRFGAGCGKGTGTPGKCGCDEDSYIVDVDCGDCGAYYDGNTKMPKYWHVKVGSSTSTPYAYYDACDSIACEQIGNYDIKLKNESGPYGGGGCSWTGKSSGCVHAELTLDGDHWKITIMDKEDCVLAVFRKPQDGFNCCGTNAGWEPDENNSCNMSVTLEPDPCTCCPDKSCPPADVGTVCAGTPCCLEDCMCTIPVSVNGLFTPPDQPCVEFSPSCHTPSGDPCVFGDPDCWELIQPAAKRCGSMDGVYGMEWQGDCTWAFRGQPAGGSTRVAATLTLSGTLWTFKILGEDGQTATFETEGWDCDQLVSLKFKGGSCDAVFPPPTANFNLCVEVN